MTGVQAQNGKDECARAGDLLTQRQTPSNWGLARVGGRDRLPGGNDSLQALDSMDPRRYQWLQQTGSNYSYNKDTQVCRLGCHAVVCSSLHNVVRVV